MPPIEASAATTIFKFSKGRWAKRLGNPAKAGLSFSGIVFHTHFSSFH
jgi:hypothetical protein